MSQPEQLTIAETEFALPFASWARVHKRPAMRDLLALLGRPGLLSLGHVLPAAELFPSGDYARLTASVLSADPGAAQYDMPCGQLKTQIVRLMELRGVRCSEEQVFLTGGAQHALSLLARLLLDPGSSFVLDSTLYDGIKVVTQPFQPVLLTVPSHTRDGMDVDAVESLLAGGARPRFIYTITDGHNPTGTSIPVPQRHRLVELARAFGVPILEDDAYGLLGFDGGFAPPLCALDSERVVYVGSFSKILAPALRLGWIVAPPELLPRLSTARQASDMDVASLTQRVVAALLERMDVAAHLDRLRREYELRRDVMLAALAEHFPPEAVWHRPPGGMFVWVELPPHVDTGALLREAVDTEGVGFIPGDAFAMGERGRTGSSLRLAFSSLPPERIAEGVQRLGRVVRRACG